MSFDWLRKLTISKFWNRTFRTPARRSRATRGGGWLSRSAESLEDRMLLSASELATLAVLCDMIIPADDKSPSASSVGAPAYVNEYVSAPYEWAEKSLVRVRGGLGWLDVESQRRFTRTFVALTNAERTQICDDICFYPDAKPQFKAAARFFGEIRNLTQSGFYTSDAGMKDLQYIGNVPLGKFEGPPPEVLKKLGLG